MLEIYSSCKGTMNDLFEIGAVFGMDALRH